MLYWFYLLLAIFLEVMGTLCMKVSEGFSKLLPSILMFVFYLASLSALNFALKKFDISMAYAIWSGLGTALITVMGFYLFKESMSLIKIVSIGLIILGVIGLHLTGEH